MASSFRTSTQGLLGASPNPGLRRGTRVLSRADTLCCLWVLPLLGENPSPRAGCCRAGWGPRRGTDRRQAPTEPPVFPEPSTAHCGSAYPEPSGFSLPCPWTPCPVPTGLSKAAYSSEAYVCWLSKMRKKHNIRINGWSTNVTTCLVTTANTQTASCPRVPGRHPTLRSPFGSHRDGEVGTMIGTSVPFHRRAKGGRGTTKHLSRNTGTGWGRNPHPAPSEQAPDGQLPRLTRRSVEGPGLAAAP